jgi:hypothetical protein
VSNVAWAQFDDDFGGNDFGGGGEDAAAAAAGLGVMIVAIVVGLACSAIGVVIAIFILLFLSGCYQRIPPQYRLLEPGMVWLLLIPCFGIVWNFFVYPRLAKSFKNYFNAHGIYDVGDCGEQLGLWYCILVCCSVIPYLGLLTSIAALVLWIIFLVKAAGLKNRIPLGAVA